MFMPQRLSLNTFDKVLESNRIEGIMRLPSEAELKMHEEFMKLRDLTIPNLEVFVKTYQPDAILRSRMGLNVRIGRFFPMAGGPKIVEKLNELLAQINAGGIDAWTAHIQYEQLHPFTDGNGRSGRAIWYWMMRDTGLENLGFLHAFYYQTLHAEQT